jgi:hypothetical protein
MTFNFAQYDVFPPGRSGRKPSNASRPTGGPPTITTSKFFNRVKDRETTQCSPTKRSGTQTSQPKSFAKWSARIFELTNGKPKRSVSSTIVRDLFATSCPAAKYLCFSISEGTGFEEKGGPLNHSRAINHSASRLTRKNISLDTFLAKRKCHVERQSYSWKALWISVCHCCLYSSRARKCPLQSVDPPNAITQHDVVKRAHHGTCRVAYLLTYFI